MKKPSIVSDIRRRDFLVGTVALFAQSAATIVKADSDAKCDFGAIRWDGQYCDTPGDPCFEEEKSLGVSKWQFRAPLHSRIVGPNSIKFEPTQVTFDAEIRAASKGGLSYWAYLMYGKKGIVDLSHPMMKGLSFHRASRIKDKMKYAMMITVDTVGHTGDYKPSVDAIVSLMKDENYQVVLNNRPVLYFYYLERLIHGYWNDSLANLAEAIASLRASAQAVGLGNPYIVLMKGPAMEAEKARAAVGADAISAYAITFPSDVDASYFRFAAFTQAYWDQEAAATTAGVVPTVMIGWDQRPRKETPPSFDPGAGSHGNIAAHITTPTPEEFADECTAAIKFIKSHPKNCESRLALIYAWNENSEGGALEPTIGDPEGSFLKALNKVIS